MPRQQYRRKATDIPSSLRSRLTDTKVRCSTLAYLHLGVMHNAQMLGTLTTLIDT